MVCASCAAADDQGIDLLQLREQNLRSRRASTVAFRAMEQTEAKQPMVKNISIEARYGQKVRVQRVITIGGQDTLVLNAAGDIIDKF